MGKTDSTGTYTYICDGASPGAAVLSDGHAVYTPGISENRGSAPLFRHDDLLGSLRFLTNGSQAVTGTLLSDVFGKAVSASGSLPSPFGFIGESGCQTDADTGLVLMGHRYYDTRIGRFLSQDPAGSGDNWYAYADNDPVNKTDASGLTPMDGPGSSPMGTPGFMGGGGGNGYGEDDSESYENNQQVNQNIADHATAIFNALAPLAQSINETANWVFNLVGPSASISLGPIHFDGSFGIAVQGPGLGATEWGLEAFGSVNAGLGIGLGLSISTGKIANLGSVGFGVGDLNGFNGGSWFGSLLAQPLGSLTYSQVMGGGYKGVQLGLPLGGIDVGLYGGAGFTQRFFGFGSQK